MEPIEITTVYERRLRLIKRLHVLADNTLDRLRRADVAEPGLNRQHMKRHAEHLINRIGQISDGDFDAMMVPEIET